MDTYDQTIKADAHKPRLSLMPHEIIFAVVAVREFGLTKYPDKDSWKQVSKERYNDALLRHLMAYLADPDKKDDESGLPHLWHAAWNIATLLELEKENDHE